MKKLLDRTPGGDEGQPVVVVWGTFGEPLLLVRLGDALQER